MAFQEKTLTCADCGKTFLFTVEEQEFFAAEGYTNEPKRCPACRQKRRIERQTGDSSNGARKEARQMYLAVCAQCGKETKVPFKPRGDRPVYCRECYARNKSKAS